MNYSPLRVTVAFDDNGPPVQADSQVDRDYQGSAGARMRNCAEYLLEYSAMAYVESILDRIDEAAKLEVVKYAA